MAINKERKQEVVSQYEGWLKDSEAVILAEYTGMTMPQFDTLRQMIRDAGGEFHVMKNTLGKRAFASAGFEAPDDFFVGSSAIGIAFDDPPGVAKAIDEYSKKVDFIQIKGGFLGQKLMSADEVKALGSLPPLPVVRGLLLGTIMAPASKLSRVLSEPGRSLAQVIKAYGESGAAAAA
ncbi:MAG: 50S ribosomal protein L10 [Anaerolineae bacterium]|nr:50S ribosomal protein L10 [Anaerolineae bacterium]